jgi:hypothetical protein
MPESTNSFILNQSIYSNLIFGRNVEFYLSGAHYCALLSAQVAKIRKGAKCVPESTDPGILCQSCNYESKKLLNIGCRKKPKKV